MENEDKKWDKLPGIWKDFAKNFIGPTNGKSDVIIGVRQRTLDELFPFEDLEDKKAHGREILDKLSEILGIPRKDMNLGVRYDDFETMTAGYQMAVHYTYRDHNGRLEHYYS